MAVALKQQAFANASELAKFAQTVGNNVTTVVSVVFDASSGKYILFYT